jgi:DsbC/DsbD-like thiol-disulfide interchange protein
MRRMRKSLLLASAMAAFYALHSAAHGQLRELGIGAPGPLKAPHVTAELISDSGTIAPGTTSRVALSLTLEPGWHVYWLYAGDAGEPPMVMWSLPQGVAVGPMPYSVPSRLPVGPLMDYGYLGTAVFPFNLTASQNLRPGYAKLTAHVQWLVCREICLPGKAYLGLNLRMVQKATDETNSVISAAASAEPVRLPSSVTIRVSANPSHLTLSIATGKREDIAEYYPLDDNSIRNAAEQLAVPTPAGIKLVVERPDVSDQLPTRLRGVLKLSGGRSYTFDVPVEAFAAPAGSGSEPGFIIAVLLAFAGGVILNLMPCVFPVLFLKGLALIGSSGESKARQRRHGLAYTVGVLCSFWVIVGLLLALRAVGKQAGLKLNSRLICRTGEPLYFLMVHDCPTQKLQINVLDPAASVCLVDLNPIWASTLIRSELLNLAYLQPANERKHFFSSRRHCQRLTLE